MHPKLKTFDHRNYESWIREKPCLVCGNPESQVHHVWCRGREKGRNSFVSVPLCVRHHVDGNPDSYHHLGIDSFEERHCLSLKDEIINYLSEYIHEKDL